jgi:hypothetical protein
VRKYLHFVLALIVISTLLACAGQNMGISNELDAGKLANEYASDLKSGNKKYKGNYITVVGKIAQQYKNK